MHPRNAKNTPHMKAMAIARAARAADGLADNFAEQTRLRNEMMGMQNMLNEINTGILPEGLRQNLKERVQEVLAITAEELYLLSGTAQS